MECKKLLLKQCRIGIVNRDDEHYEKIIEGHTCALETYDFTGGRSAGGQSPAGYRKGVLGISYQVEGLMNFPVEIDLPGRFSIYIP